MNIKPVQSDAVAQPLKAKVPAKAKASDETAPAAAEARNAERKQLLLRALASEPDIRPEVIERAKALAADPNYPSDDVLTRLAARFIGDR
jgi:hypothetical protein